MDIPEDDHVMRHIPYKKLLRDAEGNVYGILPQAFELRPEDKKKLSVNWLEYFKEDSHQKNIEATARAIRVVRKVNGKDRYAIGKVNKIKNVCNSMGAKKVAIVHSKSRGNESHASILRLPEDDLNLRMALAEEAFNNIVLNASIP